MLSFSKLDDKSFAELVEEARKLIPRYAPEWTDHNIHDPGMTLIELFAWLTEMQHFYMDQMTEKNYLPFFELLGEKPASVIPAKVGISFSLEPAESGQGIERISPDKNLSLPAGTPFYAGDICFETTEALNLPLNSLQFGLEYTVRAMQTKTIKGEWLGQGNGLPYQMLRLAHYPVLPESVHIVIWEKEGCTRWKRVDHFFASKPQDRHYVLEPMTGIIRFGDGIYGAVPPKPESVTGNNIQALRYKTSLGKKGNIASGHLKVSLTGQAELPEGWKLTATNPRAADGGSDPESLEVAKSRIRRELNTPTRAVTAADYEYLAMQTPGVRLKRAKAFVDGGGSLCQPAGTIYVVVVPSPDSAKGLDAEKPVPGSDILNKVCMHLDRRRLITTSVKVIPPVYVEIFVEAHLSTVRGALFDQVREMVENALMAFLSPLEGEQQQGWTFGRAVYLSELYEVIEKVPGVDCVHQLNASGEGANVRKDGKGNLLIESFALVYTERDKLKINRVVFN